MTGKRLGYIRVSTADQNPDRQLEGIQIDKRFLDFASGRSTDRPQLKELLDYAREDDIIIVHSMDRLARSVEDLLNIVKGLTAKGIKIQFIKENLTFDGNDSSISKLLLMIMGAVAEFEHSLILERQREGIAIAKKEGRYRGRVSKYTPELIEKLTELMQTRMSKTDIAEQLGISRFSLYRYLDDMQKKKEQANNAEKIA